MRRVPQEGQGRDRVVTQGESVTTTDGLSGVVDSFSGGSHQWVTIKDAAGYTYTTDTRKVK